MEPPTPTTPSTKLQQLRLKKDNTLTNGMQLTVRATPQTAVQAQGNSVLNSTAMSKELWITNGKDTRCQASWLEMPARASEGVQIWSWWALLVQHPRAWIWWSGIPLRAATMAAPMRKLWLEKLPSIPTVEKICRSQSVRIEPFASKKNFISTPPNDDCFQKWWKKTMMVFKKGGFRFFV